MPGPGPGVVRILDGARLLADAKRGEGVDHHSQLVGPRLAERLLRASGLRAVHEPGRVQGDRPRSDAGPLAAHEVPGDVEQDLVAVDVGVGVGDGDRLGVEVEWPG